MLDPALAPDMGPDRGAPDQATRTRVLIADDHALVRLGISALVASARDIEICGQAADGVEAVTLARELRPDITLMDLSMPHMDGVEATRRIRREVPSTHILVLTTFQGEDRVRDALHAGAIGYVLKDCAPHELLAAIRAAARGQSPLDPRIAGTLLPSARHEDPANLLSKREREVLLLVCQGLANKQIARMLHITERTVKVHLGNVFRRIGVTDRTSAALWAQAHLHPPGS